MRPEADSEIKISALENKAAILHELAQFLPGLLGNGAYNYISSYFEAAQVVRQLPKGDNQLIRIIAGYDNNTRVELSLNGDQNSGYALNARIKRFRNPTRPVINVSWSANGLGDLDNFALGFEGIDLSLKVKKMKLLFNLAN